VASVVGGAISGFFALVLIGSFVYRFVWYPSHPIEVPKSDEEIADYVALAKEVPPNPLRIHRIV